MAKSKEETRKLAAKNLAYSSGMRGSEEPPDAELAATPAVPGIVPAKEEREEPRRRRGQPKDRGVFASGLRGAEKAPAEK